MAIQLILWLDREPPGNEEVDEIYRGNIEKLIERGAFTPPAHRHPGCRFIPGALNPEDEDWENARRLWDEWKPQD